MLTGLVSAANGTYVEAVAIHSVTIVDTGTETGTDGTNKVKATAIVTGNTITVAVNN